MPTDTSGPRRLSKGQRYVVGATATGLGIFGLLRLPWVEAHLVLPVTQMQGAAAASIFNTPAAPISVTLACSGTEVLAMCLGAVLAYPVSWRARVSGAALIVAGILGLNTIRIGTLGLAAESPRWFNALHLFLWPAGLILATSGAVFLWMRHADRSSNTWSLSSRFVALATVLLVVSALAAPAYINSAAIYHIGSLIAHAGAVTLSSGGAETSASGNVLWTSRGGFSVTGDCVATPALPLYLAAVWVYASTWPRRVLGTVMAVPIFFLLGVTRLLLVALPQSMAGTEFATHAFYQVVLAGVVVVIAGLRRHDRGSPAARIIAGLVAGVVFVALLGGIYADAVLFPLDRPFLDPQGAVAFLPAFQIGLFVALVIALGDDIGWRRAAAGAAVLLAGHVAGALWMNQPGVATFLAAHISVVRAWAVAAPLVILTALVAHARARR